MKRISFIIIILCITGIVRAATYFCSPSGNGNGSSYSTPCSFSEGINKLSTGGDTLYLLGGQYNLGNTRISGKSGTSTSRYMVISGYPGELAILDFRTTAYGTRGLQISDNCTYLHIKDLTLRYSGKNNLYNEGSYCLFERLDIYGSADTGCQMKKGGNNIIKNVDSHDNFDYKHYNSAGLADFGGNADGFADKQFSGPGNHYIGCRSWNNSDDGWDFFQRVSTSESVLENCICYQNGPAEYDMRNHPRYQTDKSWFDQVNNTTVTSRYNTQVTVTLQHYPNMGNGNGFKLGGDYTAHNVLIHHCLAVSNTVRGFDQNNNAGVMRVFNNTSYANGKNFGFYANDAGPTLTIQNNISYPSSASVDIGSTTLRANDHNTWNSSTGVTLTAADFLSLDTTQILGARLSDGEFIMTVFHLSPSSDLINAGINVGLPYTGSAPDLGWVESDGVIQPFIALTSGPAEQWVLAGDTIAPVVFIWGGTESQPVTSQPEGITHAISATNYTVTFRGYVRTPGTYTLTATTTADSLNVSASSIVHVRPINCKRVAWVTIPESASDQKMLSRLGASDSLVITQLNAADATNDYSSYDAVVISPAPNSTAAAFPALKGYDVPMLVLKPFLFKASVWNWGNSVNTQDLAVTVSHPEHPIFEGLSTLEPSTLELFSSCNTNAVTAINGWNEASGQIELASPVSQPDYATITEFPVGSSVGGTTFTSPLLMVGLSEYSTANLTDAGLTLLENALCYLLGISKPSTVQSLKGSGTPCRKYLQNGRLIIERQGIRYTATGQRL